MFDLETGENSPDVTIETVENGFIVNFRKMVSVIDEMTLPQRQISADMVSGMTNSNLDIEDFEQMSPRVLKVQTFVATDLQSVTKLLSEHMTVPDQHENQAERVRRYSELCAVEVDSMLSAVHRLSVVAKSSDNDTHSESDDSEDGLVTDVPL